MMQKRKGNNWCFNQDIIKEDTVPGASRKVLAFDYQAMCVENYFTAGAVGPMHQHPHTQITYVAEGVFRFTMGEESRIVRRGDTMLQEGGLIHGCECLEDGILIDFFTPMREDFVK